jgi:hypothetical protein
LRNVVKKVPTFSAPPPIKILHQWVARRGMCPVVTDTEKPFTLSQYIEKLQHFEIRFDAK